MWIQFDTQHLGHAFILVGAKPCKLCGGDVVVESVDVRIGVVSELEHICALDTHHSIHKRFLWHTVKNIVASDATFCARRTLGITDLVMRLLVR